MSRIRQRPGVSDVRYDRQWLDRLAAVVAVIRGMGLLLGSVPTVVAGLTVANVVRGPYARRDEVSIMQLSAAISCCGGDIFPPLGRSSTRPPSTISQLSCACSSWVAGWPSAALAGLWRSGRLREGHNLDTRFGTALH